MSWTSRDRSVFDGLFNEIARRESFYGSFMEAYALQLLLAICRAFADSNLNSSGDCTADAKELMVHEIIRYIDANIENIDNLCDLTRCLSTAIRICPTSFATRWICRCFNITIKSGSTGRRRCCRKAD